LTLNFNAANWNIPQLVQAGAADDGIVENFHTSQINFKVQAGRQLDGPTVANISTAAQAFDLGDISGGVRWSNLNLPLKPGSTQPTDDGSIWIAVDFPDKPGPLTQIRMQTAGDNSTDLPDMTLYKADGTTLVAQGVRTAAVTNTTGYIVTA